MGRRQYEQLPHVMVAFGPGEAMSTADVEVERLGIERRVVATTPSFLLLPFLLRGTSIVTLLPRRLGERFREDAGLQLCRPPFPLPQIDIRMIWSPTLTSDPAHRWLRETLREAARHSRF